MEKRQLLTMFVVNTQVDDISGTPDGMISFSEAVIAANTNSPFGDAPAGETDGDVIRFTNQVGHISISNEIEIQDDLLIQGGGGQDGHVTISALDSRIFRVSTSERVAIGKLNMTGGTAPDGGAIHATGGVLVVVSSTFESNVADAHGGAIYQVGGYLRLNGSKFSRNESSLGGAVFTSSGVTTVVDSEFERNVVSVSGGAIHVDSSRLNLKKSDFELNQALPGQGESAAVGGAVALQGESYSVLEQIDFQFNQAKTGGAVWISADSSMVGYRVGLEHNSTEGGNGGAIRNEGTLILRQGSLNFNRTYQTLGGAISAENAYTKLSIMNAKASGLAAEKGGLVHANGGRMIYEKSILDTETHGANADYGGYFHVEGDAYLRLDNNFVQGAFAEQQGGAIWMDSGTTVVLTSGSFGGNRARGTSKGSGGGVVFNAGGELHVREARMNANEAREGGAIFLDGGTADVTGSNFYFNQTHSHGGAIKVQGDAVLRLKGSSLSSNVAGPDPEQVGNGGVLSIDGPLARADLSGNRVWSNEADNGGAFAVGFQSTLSVTGEGTLNGNDARDGFGGAIYNEGHTVISGIAIEYNSATSHGGAIYVADEGATILREEAQISHNESGGNGGGVFTSGYLDSHFASFFENDATGEGNEVYVDDGRWRE